MAIDTSLQSNIVSNVSTQAFTLEANAHVFQMLFKNVYNNVILAGMRELSTNAIDACIDAGKDIKFDVHLPTMDEPTFSVRDYGTGLSVDSVANLYTVMGASSKRDSNAYNGQFGIGKLAPLAYTSSFTVDSYHNNQHHSYLVSVQDGIPSSVHLFSNASSEPSGLKVSYVVQQKDIHKFTEKAKKLYKYFSHKPNLNIDLDLDIEKSISGDDWFIEKNGWEYKAVMGNVTYSIYGYEFDFPTGTVLEIPIGSVSITPGRESLTYDDKTTAYLKARSKKLYEGLQELYDNDRANCTTPMEIAITNYNWAKSFSNRINISTGSIDMVNQWGSHYARFNHDDITFATYVSNGKSQSLTSISSDPSKLKFLIQDVIQNSTAYLMDYFDDKSSYEHIILKPVSRSNKALEALIAAAEPYLKSIGVTEFEYLTKEASIEDVEVATKSKLASHLFQAKEYSTYSENYRVYKTLNSATEDEYVYMINGEEEDFPICQEIIKTFNLDVPKLILAPKKVKKDLAVNPNFHPAKEYIQAILDGKTFPVHSSKAGTLYMARVTDDIPADIKDAISAGKEWRDKDYVWQSDIDKFSKVFNLNTETFDHDLDFIDSKYPLFWSNYQADSKLLSRYLVLEDLHAKDSSS